MEMLDSLFPAGHPTGQMRDDYTHLFALKNVVL